MWLDHLLLEERTLNRSQRNLTGRKTLQRRRRRSSGNRDLREISNRLMPKDESGRKFQTCLICARDDLDRENRIAAKLEEAVVNAELLATEHLLPYFRECLFDRSARRRVNTGRMDHSVIGSRQ